MVNTAQIRYIRTMNTVRTTLIAIAAAAYLQPITSYAQTAGADPTAPFYQQTVFAIGFGEGRACESMEETPSALWGNQERVDETDRVSQSGRVLTITGKHKDRSTTTYRFFLRRDECVAAAQTAGLKIAPLEVVPATTAQPEEPPKPRMWFWGDDVVTRAGTTWYVTDVKAHATCAPIPIKALQQEEGYLQSQGLDSFKRINDTGEPDLQVMQVATIALSAHPTMASCQKHLTDDRRMQGFGQ